MRQNDEIFSEDVRSELESLPEALIILSYIEDAYRLILCSDRMCVLTGMDREEIWRFVRGDAGDFIHEQDREKLLDSLNKSLECPGKSMELNVRLARFPGGAYRRFIGEITGKIGRGNEPLIYIRCSDMTIEYEEMRKLQYREKEREALFAKVLDTTQDCLFWKDRERRFVGVNQAFLDFFGFESQDVLIGKTDEDMKWHPYPESFKADEESVLAGSSTYMVHGTCIIRGEERDILATKAPIYDGEDIIGLVGSFIDVTEDYRRRREVDRLDRNLQRALKKERDALRKEREANRSISYFMSRVSHELRTPMNAIIGLSMLGMEQTKLEKSREYHRKINTSGQYLLGIVNDVLDINKIEDGRFSLHLENTDFNELVSAINTIIRPIADMKEIQLQFDLQEMKEPAIVCDSMRLQQILINILNNAVKFTDPGGKVMMRVLQVVEQQFTRMTFIIEDSGCGMSEEFLKKIFKPFAQENRNPSKYGKGTGLGLTLSRTLARIMGGDIGVTSREGEGSVFTVTAVFGVARSSTAKENKKQKAKLTGYEHTLHGRCILLAEDNEINAEVTTGLMNRVGIETVWVHNGLEAVDEFVRAGSDFFDAILMDVQMPVMDGYEAAGRIRTLPGQRGADIPIIAMSADIFDAAKQKAYESGMNDYVTKPIDMDTLYKTIEIAIQHREEEIFHRSGGKA